MAAANVIGFKINLFSHPRCAKNLLVASDKTSVLSWRQLVVGRNYAPSHNTENIRQKQIW